MKKKHLLIVLFLISQVSFSQSKRTSSRNPVFPDCYADPEGIILKKKYLVFAAFSTPYNQQVFFNAFSSPDLLHFTKNGPDYSVAYSASDSPFGPFERIGKILQQDPKVATGVAPQSLIQISAKDQWYTQKLQYSSL